jgi:hypothetical protein
MKPRENEARKQQESKNWKKRDYKKQLYLSSKEIKQLKKR